MTTLSEGPGDPRAGQAFTNMLVLAHVKVIIEVDEAMAERLAEDGHHRQ